MHLRVRLPTGTLAIVTALALVATLSLTLTGRHSSSSPPCARSDARMERIWRDSGSGWAGGDGALSLPLGAGESAWLFGDSLLYDKVTGERQFVRNAVLKLGSTVPRVVAPARRTSYFRIPGSDDSSVWLWPSHGIMRGDSVWVFLSEEHGGTEKPMDWAYGGLWLARLSRASLALQSLERWHGPADVMWGAWMVASGKWVYIFGVEHRSQADLLHLARTRSINQASAWRYWDGHGWSRSSSAAAAIARGVGDQLSVVPVRGGFRLLTTHGLESRAIVSFTARALEGPWHRADTIAVPAVAGSHIYAVSAHPEVSRSALIVSYSEWIPGRSPTTPRFARVAWRCLALR